MITRVFKDERRKQKSQNQRHGIVSTLITAGFEDIREQRAMQVGKGKETVGPLRPPETNSPTDTLISGQQDPFWTSDLQTCKIINLYL